MFQLQVMHSENAGFGIAGGIPITQTNTLSEAREMFANWRDCCRRFGLKAQTLYYSPDRFRILNLKTLEVHPVISPQSPFVPYRAGDKDLEGYKKRGTPTVGGLERRKDAGKRLLFSSIEKQAVTTAAIHYSIFDIRLGIRAAMHVSHAIGLLGL